MKLPCRAQSWYCCRKTCCTHLASSRAPRWISASALGLLATRPSLSFSSFSMRQPPPPNPIISNLPHCSLTQCLPNSTLFFPMSNVQCPMTIPPLQDAARICSVGFASPLTSLVSNFKPHICFCTPSVVIRYNRT
jgi:hypothetical protein